MKTSPIMWIIYFITSFAAFHYGMMAFDFNLLALPFVAKFPMLPKIVMIIFGACGLVSLIALFTGCKECK